MNKTEKVIVGVGLSLVAVFIIGYVALGPLGRVFVRDPVGIFDYGVNTIAKTADKGVDAATDKIQSVLPKEENNNNNNNGTGGATVGAGKAQLVESTRPVTTKWTIASLDDTFQLRPQEKRIYSLTVEPATTAQLTGTTTITKSSGVVFNSPLLVIADDGDCSSKANSIYGSIGFCHYNIVGNKSPLNLSLYTGKAQKISIENTSAETLNVKITAGIDYTRTVQEVRK